MAQYSEQKIDGITFTRINCDVNGNPRYVVHFPAMLGENEFNGDKWQPIREQFAVAHQRAKQIGGAKYRAKWFGGGLVFSSYSLPTLAKDIKKLRK